MITGMQIKYIHIPFLTYEVGKNKKNWKYYVDKTKRKQTLSFNAGGRKWCKAAYIQGYLSQRHKTKDWKA